VDKEAVDKEDSSGTEEPAPDDREAVTPAGPPSGNGNGRGPRPSLRPGQPITEYSDRQLASVIRWIESDTLLRTEDELLAAFVSELGYRRRGPRIVEAFQRALTIARGSAVAADSRPTIAREESGGGE
jgi:hypothetical protein